MHISVALLLNELVSEFMCIWKFSTDRNEFVSVFRIRDEALCRLIGWILAVHS